MLLALLAYVPLLWNSPGRVTADTKSYLYLDPSRLLARAPYLWDQHVGLGTVTHQNIGYLFPMGPYYWLMEQLRVPDWVAQRLWLGTLLFAAGTGIVAFARAVDWPERGISVAAVFYMWSPYLTDYAARISAILMPWAGLGWMMAFVVRSLTHRGWRWPARFALAVGLVGTVNATSLILAGIAPVLWIGYAIATGQVSVRRAVAAASRIGVLCVGVSLWWIVGLRIQGAYGVPILRFTETSEAVSRTSSAAEVLRGLGYWYFYGQDKVAPWVQPARPYTQQVLLVVTSFGTAALGLWSLALGHWKHRRFVAVLLVVGVAVSAGAYPFANPSPAGSVFKRFVETTAGMALRSTPRAVPLVLLALSLAVGQGVARLASHLRNSCEHGRAGRPICATVAQMAVLGLLALNTHPLLLGHLYTPSLLRSEYIPAYWNDAASALDTTSSTRVWETPGIDFADYRWGGTVDPITPGLIERPYVARELIPYGSPGAADLLNAIERRLNDNLGESAAIAPLARLMSAGTVAVRNDLQYERYRTVRPQAIARLMAAADLGQPAVFGSDEPANRPISRLPLIDEYALTAPPNQPEPPPVALYDVADAPPFVRTESRTTVVAGDGEGMVDLAGAGLLPTGGVVLYDADLAVRPHVSTVPVDVEYIVTDSNRKQARRWGSVRENLGYTESVGERPLRRDPNDNRLDLFADASDADRTVTEQRGVVRVQATGYGNPITYTPEDRAANAFDNDPLTSWRVGAFADVTGERIELETAAPITTDHIAFLQPTSGVLNRWLTQVRLNFDNGPAVIVDLDDSSRTQPGQTITFPTQTFTTLRVEIAATNFTKLPGYRGLASVGFAEIRVGSVVVDEVVRLPTAALSRADTHPLTVMMVRQRSNGLEQNRTDPELSLRRSFTLPTKRTMTVSGTARLSGVAADSVLDRATQTSGAVLESTARLLGDPQTRASSAFDLDASSAWVTPIDKWRQSLTITNSVPTSFDSFDLTVRADGRFSIPTVLLLSIDGGEPERLVIPPITPDSSVENNTATVRVSMGRTVTAATLAITVDEIAASVSRDYFSELPIDLPVAISELTIPGGAVNRSGVATDCRDDLVTLDGTPVTVWLSLVADGTYSIVGCNPVAVSDGEHLLTTAVGRATGIDVDRLILSDDIAGSTNRGAAPIVTATSTSPVSYDISIAASTESFWLVLAQSYNPGWKLTGTGFTARSAAIIDGYASGWWITPTGGPMSARLEWTPQRLVWIGLAASAVAMFLTLGLAFRQPRRLARSAARQRRAVPAPTWPAVWACAAWGVAGPTVAAGVLVVGLVVRRWPRTRVVLATLSPACIGVIAAFVIAKSARYNLPTDLEWPRSFGPAHQLAWLAVFIAAVSTSELAPDASGGVAHADEHVA